jgi:hypothetical protein
MHLSHIPTEILGQPTRYSNSLSASGVWPFRTQVTRMPVDCTFGEASEDCDVKILSPILEALWPASDSLL